MSQHVDVLWESEGDARGAMVSAVSTWANALLEASESAQRSLSIVLCDDAYMRDLNNTWRGVDASTDVLSFPMDEGEKLADGEAPSPLGDVVISLETAARQAPEHGYTVEEELRLLLVHGLCHLLGYDHAEPDEAEAMRTMENKLLNHLDPNQTRPTTFY